MTNNRVIIYVQKSKSSIYSRKTEAFHESRLVIIKTTIGAAFGIKYHVLLKNIDPPPKKKIGGT